MLDKPVSGATLNPEGSAILSANETNSTGAIQARSQRFALGGSGFKTQKATPTFVSSLIILQY